MEFSVCQGHAQNVTSEEDGKARGKLFIDKFGFGGEEGDLRGVEKSEALYSTEYGVLRTKQEPRAYFSGTKSSSSVYCCAKYMVLRWILRSKGERLLRFSKRV